MKRVRPRRIAVRADDRGHYEEDLEAIPRAPRETKLLTIRQAIRELTPTIAKLMRRGYCRAKIIELLKEQAIDCTAATFRTVYRAPKPRTQDGKRRASNTETAGTDRGE